MFLHDFSLQLLSFFVAIIARKCDESGVGGTSEEIAIILSVILVHNIYQVVHNIRQVVHNICPQHVSSSPQHASSSPQYVPTTYI